MKKQLFTILSALSLGALSAQTPSPSWSIAQHANFPFAISGHQYMDAVSPSVAWVSGFDGQSGNGLNWNYVSVTSNGGTTWSANPVFPDTNSWRISNLEGFDANTAWVAAYNNATGGGGSIWRTINGGSSWSNVTPAGMYTNTAAFANWITWLDASTAIVHGDPVNGEFELWRTTNGATSWTLVPGANIPNPLSGEYGIVDLYTTLGPTHMWFGTNRGRVYRTADAGVTWSVSPVISANTATLLEIDFASTTNGLAYMINTVSGGVIYELYNTTDGGITWNKIPGQNISIAGGTLDLPANYGLNEMQPVPGTNWFVSAGNSTISLLGLSYSKDNGVTWTDWGATSIGYNTIDMADRFTGWAGGYAYAANTASDVLHKYAGHTFNAMFTIPQSVCLGSNNVTLTPVNTSSSAAGSYSFNWSSSPAAGFSSNTASVPVITFTAPGSYTVLLSVVDASGTGTLSQVIEVASCSAPVASFTMSSQGCQNTIMTLTNTSTGGPAPSVTVSSNPSTNVQIVNVGSNQYNLIFADPGTYTINMFGSSISGTTSAQQVVTISDCRPNVTFTMSSDVACRKGSNGLADTVYIHPVFNNTFATSNYTWAVTPFTGITAFPNISGTLTPPGKKLALSTSTAAYGYTLYIVKLTVANQYGTTEYTDSLRVTIDNCTGLEEHGGWTTAVSVFPNPAHDKITVSVPASIKPYSVKVVNLLGSVVFEDRASTTGEININLEAVKKGVYFVQIENSGTTVTRKFIVD